MQQSDVFQKVYTSIISKTLGSLKVKDQYLFLTGLRQQQEVLLR